jgi:Ser/Thr protein kinase RdoA (MazF antagonist)
MRNYFKNIGGWLKYFQSLENSQPEYYSIDTLVEYLNIRLKILGEDPRRHFNPRYSKKILEFIEKNRNLVTTQELYIKSSHNDFNLSNIIIQNDSRVTILDFSKIYKDSFILDVSRVYHQLYLITFKPHYKTSVIKELQKALLKGFGLEHADRLMLFRFFLIRHTLTHLVGITRFWKVNFKERLYNHWVLHKELNYLEHLMQSTISIP